MTLDQEGLTAEEAEVRARNLRLKYELRLATGERDARKVIDAQEQDKIRQAEDLAVRLCRRQEEVARFRTSLAEVSVLAAAAVAAVASIATSGARARQAFGFAALSFISTSLLSLAPYALAISRTRPRCERFGEFDWAALTLFLIAILLVIVAAMSQ